MSRDAESEDSLVGEVLAGRYVVEACIGEGAMGAVYRARHAEVGRLFAIKILHPRFRGDERTNRRFMREAKLAGTLRHPNVVSVVDVGELGDGRRYLVMDHADGPTLLDLINESSPMPTARVIKLVKQLCAGLHHAHEHGLIHRDFKPDNVIVERDRHGDETPRIVDFGIAILRDDLAANDTDRLTTGGLVLGTPHYMSPEHATGAPIDHRIDLFALGVTCFEMIAGVSPYEGDGVDVARANLLLDTPVMAVRVPGLVVDPLLEAFTRKLMMKSRDDRPPTAGAARDLLELMERDRNAAAAALGIDLRDPAPWAPARRGARAPAPPPMMHAGAGAMPAPATIPAHAAHAVMSPHVPHTAMPAHVSLPHTMPALGDPPPWPTPQGSSPPPMNGQNGQNGMNGMAPSATPSIIVEQEPLPAPPPPSAAAYPPTWPSPLPWPGTPAHHANHTGHANHPHHARPAGTASEATEQILPMSPRRASYALPIIAAVAFTAVIVAMAISLNRRDARSNAAAAAARRAEPHVMAPPVAPAPVAMTATPPPAVAPTPAAPPPAPVAPAASAPTPAATSPTPAATAPPPAPAPVAVAVAPAPAAPAHPAPRAETPAVEPARTAPPAKPEPAVEPAPAPAAPPAKLTAARVAELYATVGRELKALDQSQGPSSTSELWPTYLQIRINDVITDPRKLEPTNATLLKLSSQISRRR